MGARGFWIGLIAGLSVAALLLTLRLVRVVHKHRRKAMLTADGPARIDR
jgi:MATE family multidrug resistance protein